MLTLSDLLIYAGVTLGVMSLSGMLLSGVLWWRQRRRKVQR